LVSSLFVLLALTFVVFILQFVVPGDPVRALLGPRVSQSVVNAARHRLGLDGPLYQQYFDFIRRLLHGDLGYSFSTGRPVLTDIRTYAPATLELAAAGFAFACGLGMLLGIWSAARWRGSGAVRLLILSSASIPQYFVALILVLVLAVHVHVLPFAGQIDPRYAGIAGPSGFLLIDMIYHGDIAAFGSALSHLIIPAVAIGLLPAAAIGRSLRSTLQDVLKQDYIRAAEAKGLRQASVVLRHGLRNAIGPVLSIAGLQLGSLIGGVIVVEQLVDWPGLGQYTVNALSLRDLPAIMGVVLIGGTAFVVINAAVDFLQLAADPRIRGAIRQGRRVMLTQGVRVDSQ
jgi:peptide/nickel transport system permease protein